MEVWHSTPQKATKFYHERCQWSFLGYDALGHRPCIALQLNAFGPDGAWYQFTANQSTMDSDGEFCCESTLQNNQGLSLGTINRKFMENMKYIGNTAYNGDYYQGPAKMYVSSLNHPEDYCPGCMSQPTLPLNVWYETDLEGKPLRFGELGQELELDGILHDMDLPLVYEEMDPLSFTDQSMRFFDASVFDIPEICKQTTYGCHPGRVNRNRQSIVFGPH